MLVRARVRGPSRVAGVDEAGRGPLAGPVVAAAVILNPRRRIDGLADSKVLTAETRERLAPIIRTRALAWAVAWADRDEIDSLNILGATFLAMRRALMGLPVCPTHIQVDGNQLPHIEDLNLGCTVESIIEGDASIAAISAASILAKTCRDAMMESLDRSYPGFQLGIHKGYGTPGHLEALRGRDPSPLHRRSFSPVRLALEAVLDANAAAGAAANAAAEAFASATAGKPASVTPNDPGATTCAPASTAADASAGTGARSSATAGDVDPRRLTPTVGGP